MNVLVACEESQRVMFEFRKLGHNAFSCDLQDCSGGYPQYHLKGDAISVIENGCWDLIVAHPPCTYLARSGACRLFSGNNGEIKDLQRYENMLKAREFFMFFYNLTGCKVAIENPTPMKVCQLPKWSQVIQPFQFGANYSKQTCLWLKDLPFLMPTCMTLSQRSFGESWCRKYSSAKMRSKTFPEVAQAMALQWGR